ncbi:MAG: hypothetical protein E7585_06540 [Ruminococcaceae bacterium]|nr:hypothetical protein [Oscillospiraceae bacterium]
MKTFIRVLSGVLLGAILLTFTLWRHDAFPDVSGLVSFLRDTAGRIHALNEYQADTFLSGTREADRNADYQEYELSEPLDAELETLICDALLNYESEVDVSAKRKTPAEIKRAMTEVRFTHPELFYVDKGYTYSPNGEYVGKLQFQYTTSSKAEAMAMVAEYQNMLSAIVANAPVNGTDFDKALYIHDYFIRDYCYDYTYTIRDAYTFFKQKTGVCQAYMLAMIAVAEELGLQSVPVTSSRMNHAWNLVELDGAWYHMDITWDDTVSYPSYVSYQYFLQSDVGIVDIDRDRVNANQPVPDWHCDWSTIQAANDSRYDDAVWRTCQTPMVKGNGAYHCVITQKESGLNSVSGAVYSGADPTAMTKNFSVNGTWRLPDGNHYYVDCYTGLAVWGDQLIYNTPNSLRSYDLKTGKDKMLTLLVEINPRSIYGLIGVSESGLLSYVVAYTADPEEDYPTIEIRTYQLS